jgi:sugar phosphate isomerase/epimerase
MKLCGHTMGTPALTLYEAMEFFAATGYDGIEIRCAENAHLQPEKASESELERIRERAGELGLEIACLTPYYGDYTSPAATAHTIEGLTKVARAAEVLGCKVVRAIAGRWPCEGLSFETARLALADGLCMAADAAAPLGVTLAVETHGGTLAANAEAALSLIQAVSHPNVRLLLDYYWLYAAGDKDPDVIMRDLAPLTVHVHVKDLAWRGEEHQAVPLGQGEINWPLIFAHLLQVGYQGFLSDEYEKLWRPHLPEPEEAMPANRATMLDWLLTAEELLA